MFLGDRGLGFLQVIEQAYPDPAALSPGDIDFGDEFDFMMTEIDAVYFPSRVSERFCLVQVDCEIDHSSEAPWREQFESRMRNEKTHND